MHVVLLRLALGLYSVGFAHAVLTALNKKQTFFRTALLGRFLPDSSCRSPLSFCRRWNCITCRSPSGMKRFHFSERLRHWGFLIAYAKYRIVIAKRLRVSAHLSDDFHREPLLRSSSSIPPVLRSNWIYIHIPMVFLGYAALFIAFAAAIMYLIQERAFKSKHPVRFYNWLPSLEICDDLAYRSLAIGFPLITLGHHYRRTLGEGARLDWARDAKVLFSRF